MSRVNTPSLSASARQELEHLQKTSRNHVLRTNCHLVLLKAEGRPSKDVGSILGMSDASVNAWLRRYKTEGIAGLTIKPGRGRKPLMDKSDAAAVRRSIAAHRQRAEHARQQWQAESNKTVSRDTFRRFLKVLVDDSSACENATPSTQTQSTMPTSVGA
jgi:transposase